LLFDVKRDTILVMKFYTHVFKAFNKIYVRGYEDGRRYQDIIEYAPYTFVLTENSGEEGYKTLDGRGVSKVPHGSMRDAAQHINTHKGTEGYKMLSLIHISEPTRQP
jgi:hypothetical protein